MLNVYLLHSIRRGIPTVLDITYYSLKEDKQENEPAVSCCVQAALMDVCMAEAPGGGEAGPDLGMG